MGKGALKSTDFDAAASNCARGGRYGRVRSLM
jgi:hypothetical protein